ncbi:hypothetical protein [Qipengyuania marisflavi]|uniref:Uncharacterized protein n=1 Tax=Qipengyuania marisflavi TaxID=2486356 RepID=A0A5S3P8H8_9SPHN|nr:hypothetical protein [Qipengyuania marisflavi]TMM48744.1 hypothetical protein FEV51_04935 [Qipengyuania marisflavi]
MSPMYAIATLALAPLAALTAQIAHAQTQPADSPLLPCRAIEKKSDRLECYDRAMDAVYGVDQALMQQREESRRNNFGDADAAQEDRATEITATITNMDYDQRYDILQIELDNGQVWRATSLGALRNGFERGQVVLIKKSGLGGYKLTMEGRNGFRGVQRVR